jgi:nicotinamide mononucleotide (NMN) deamidase PncC
MLRVIHIRPEVSHRFAIRMPRGPFAKRARISCGPALGAWCQNATVAKSAASRCRQNASTAIFAKLAVAKLRDVAQLNQQQLVERIHAAAKPLVLSITGGGSGAIAALLKVPGASATVLEAVVPYSAVALQQWLGGPVDHYCSERTARAMAMAAFERARQLSDADPRTLCGIGATASLASNRPKLGAHRIHVAWQSADTTAVVSCEFQKGARTREEEEDLSTTLILNAVAGAKGIDAALPFEINEGILTRRRQHAPQAEVELLLGERTHVTLPEPSTQGPARVLFPGAFNPVHSAHRRMAQLATKRLRQPVTYELSITNVDKPPLDFIEIGDRLAQFAGESVLLSRAPRFVDKARLAPGCAFVVGIDTIVRISDPKYYQGGAGERDAAVAAIAQAGCRFLVFGRRVGSGFYSLANISVSPALLQMCDEVSESEFRDDISSTELRNV